MWWCCCLLIHPDHSIACINTARNRSPPPPWRSSTTAPRHTTPSSLSFIDTEGNSCRDPAHLHQLAISKSQAPVHANAKLPIPRFTRSTNQLRGNRLINHGCRGLFMIQHLPLLTADAAQKREMKTSTIQAAPIRRSRLNSTPPFGRPTEPSPALPSPIRGLNLRPHHPKPRKPKSEKPREARRSRPKIPPALQHHQSLVLRV